MLFSWMEYVFHLGVGVLSSTDVVTGQQSWQMSQLIYQHLKFCKFSSGL